LSPCLLVAALTLALSLLAGTGARAQQPPRPVEPLTPAEQLQKDFPIQLEPPGPDRIFRVESETALRERIRQEFRQRNERAEFPVDISLVKPGEKYAPRFFPPSTTIYVPDAVCYKPLYFEDKNTERHGWDTGIFQPILSAAKFYGDLAILPYNMGVQHPCSCEFNTGYYKPGDPVPYYCYLPPPSWKGAALQTAVIVGGIAIFP
jgi:hypothetical protein